MSAELTAREKRILRAGGDPWLEDLIEEDRYQADRGMVEFYRLEAERKEAAHRDLDTIDGGLLGPSRDLQRALDDDWRRATE